MSEREVIHLVEQKTHLLPTLRSQAFILKNMLLSRKSHYTFTLTFALTVIQSELLAGFSKKYNECGLAFPELGKWYS